MAYGEDIPPPSQQKVIQRALPPEEPEIDRFDECKWKIKKYVEIYLVKLWNKMFWEMYLEPFIVCQEYEECLKFLKRIVQNVQKCEERLLYFWEMRIMNNL